jgi:hypothetical protein
MYEELLNDEEIRRTVELDRYFVVLPALQSVYQSISYTYDGMVPMREIRSYNSSVEEHMSPEDLTRFLRKGDLFDERGE